MAIVASANLIMEPKASLFLQTVNALSKTGVCRAFSDEADGMVRGEGCVVMVLKSYQEAIQDGDPIQAVIRASAINHGGRSAGLTVPNPLAQADLMRRVLNSAAVPAQHVQYVEAHGTGTPVGDPIELEAIAQALCQGRDPKHTLYVGSVKTNIGHTDSVAGMAGLLKTVLSLQHNTIPASLHFSMPNQKFDWSQYPIEVPCTSRAFAEDSAGVFACVNSLGMSGAYASLLLAKPLSSQRGSQASLAYYILPVSAKSLTALQSLLKRYKRKILTIEESDLYAFCRSAALHREHFAYRYAVTFQSKSELLALLEDVPMTTVVAHLPLKTLEFSVSKTHLPWQALCQSVMVHPILFKASLADSYRVNLGAILDTSTVSIYSLEDRLCVRLQASAVLNDLYDVFSKLYQLGYNLQWHKFYAEYAPYFPLPNYAWDHQPYWTLKQAPLYVQSMVAAVDEQTQPPSLQSIVEFIESELKSFLLPSEYHLISPHSGFFLMGLDSIMTQELTNHINKQFSLNLDVQLLFEYSNMNRLSSYIYQQLQGDSRAKPLRENTVATTQEKIAVIGMSCRFPSDIVDPDSYWAFLVKGGNSVTDIPLDRWDATAIHEPGGVYPGKIYSTKGSFLSKVSGFDHEFFKLSRTEAMALDPQQRIMLELAWEALESAGISPETIQGQSLGIYVGAGSEDYAVLRFKSRELHSVGAYDFSGTDVCMISGRIAHALGVHGPAVTLDTACSSSLTAIHLAIQGLQAGDCDWALAGGVNLCLDPANFVAQAQMSAMSRSGQCRTFDASADGYVRGEGAGFVLLQPLNKALQAKRPIVGVIRASVMNHDGASSGLAVPNPLAQKQLFRLGLAKSGLDGTAIQYLEAHGTGTPLGDPIEFSSIVDVFAQQRASDNPLSIGSVKTNIGHLEAASGIASFIKVMLMLQHQAIPPHLHLQTLNPRMRLQDVPIEIPVTYREASLRYAAVNAFGMSGTNVHIVLERSLSNAKLHKVFHPWRHQAHWIQDAHGAYQSMSAIYSNDFSKSKEQAMTDTLYAITWEPYQAVTPSLSATRDWVVIKADDPTEQYSSRFLEYLQACNINVLLVSHSESDYQEGVNHLHVNLNRAEACEKLLSYLQSWTQKPIAFLNCIPLSGMESPLKAQERYCGSLLCLAQQIYHSKLAYEAKLFLLTTHAQYLEEDQHINVNLASVWSLGRTMSMELAGLWGGMMDLDSESLVEPNYANKLYALMNSMGHEKEIVIRKGQYYVPRLQHRGMSTQILNAEVSFSGKKYHVITGGLSLLARRLVPWMQRQGARQIYLLGRQALNAESHAWLSAQQQEGFQVWYSQVDVSDEAKLRAFMTPLKDKLAGIMHAAGDIHDGSVTQLVWAKLVEAMRAKVLGTDYLDQLTEEIPLDYFILFSSMASLLAYPGRASYAAANSYLNAVAVARSLKGLPALSIAWGPWKNTRMSNKVSSQEWAHRGVTLLDSDQYFSMMMRLSKASLKIPCVGLAAIDWTQYSIAQPSVKQFALLSQLISDESISTTPSQSVMEDLRVLPASNRKTHIQEVVTRVVKNVLGGSGISLDIQKGFIELGVDSLMAVTIAAELSKGFGLVINDTITFEYSSIAKISDYICHTLFPIEEHDSAADQSQEALMELLRQELG